MLGCKHSAELILSGQFLELLREEVDDVTAILGILVTGIFQGGLEVVGVIVVRQCLQYVRNTHLKDYVHTAFQVESESERHLTDVAHLLE